MKKVILLVLLMPYMAYGQIVENFESGNINNWAQSNDGRWKADTVASLSGRYSLHHVFDNPDAGTDRIGIPTSDFHPSKGKTRWSFLVRHGYDPSSSNNWAVFLMSDKGPAAMSPDGGTNGFAIGVNLTGYDDTLRLWKIKGSIPTIVVNCHVNWQTLIGSVNAAKIIVDRSTLGNWTVSLFALNENLIGSASGNESELFNPSWFGIFYRYSSTRDQLFWFDDLNIEGNFSEDNEAPAIASCVASGKNSVDITLNEEPAGEFMVPENFSLNSNGNKPLSIDIIKPLTYRVKFTGNFLNRSESNLIINSLCDKSGNCTRNIEVPFTPVWAESGDVIISEIMADPVPEVSLPQKEYLEITNRTKYSFNLINWNLSSESQKIKFPESVLKPSEIAIICLSQDTSLFTKFGKVIGFKQLPSLSDDGKIIWLSDSTGNLIHGVEYSSDWYGDELKSKGGWSLEMIDTHFPFYSDGNWTASVSRKGGTPGSENSVTRNNSDVSFYGIENVFPVDSSNLRIRFSEPVFDLSVKSTSITIGGKGITDIFPADPLFREFSVAISDPLLRRERYQVNIAREIKDFAGNSMQKTDFDFGLPEPAESDDILFNELLFNPLPGDPDYLELYNRSDKVIDVSRLQLVSVDDDTADTSLVSQVSDEKRCIMPGSYYALTTDRERISARYFSSDPEHLFQTVSLPSMSDDKGHLILLNRELDVIDEVFYNQKMHYSLLSGYEGVALEKTGPKNKSEEALNWHSASESSGWGTPGAPNSVFVELPVTSDKVVFSSSRITPDNDGNEDILVIRFNLTGNGNVVSVMVFDETGNYVKKIAANLLAGPEASLIWDGTANDGSLVRTGIYIVFITLFDDTGKTNKWKKVCTVIRN